MATSTEMIKARELMKTGGMNLKDAVSQVRTPITNAPVAGVAPTPTAPLAPIQTPPAGPTPGSFGDQAQGMNVDQRRALRDSIETPTPTPPVTPPSGTTTPSGTTLTPDGQIIQQNGINSVQPLNNTIAPVQPATPKTTPPVKTDTVDYTQGAGREADINKNLNDFYTQGTTDPTSLKTMSGYDQATPEKKAIIDAFISAKAPNADNLFMNLRSGVAVAQSLQNTPEYKQAQARYNKLQTYQRYSPAQVTTALRTGDIIPGTKEYNDLYTDPAVKTKIDEANAFAVINGGYDLETIGTKKTSELISQNTNVSNALSDGYISEDELKSMTNTQEVSSRATDYQTKSDIYTKKKTEYDNISKTVRDDMDKLGLSSFSSVVNARVAEAREALLPELTIAQNEMNTSYGVYTDAKAQALSVVDRNIALYQEQQKFAQQKEMVQYQADVGLQTKQKEFEQQIEQQAQLASDPVTGVKGIMSTFAKMGIFADRSEAEIIQDVKNKVASGKTVGQALSELTAGYKSKPEYQKQLSLTMGQLSDSEKMNLGYAQDLNKMAIGNKYDLQKIGINNQQDIQKLVMNYDLKNSSDIQASRIDLMSKGASAEQADVIIRNATGNWKGATGETLLGAVDGTIIPSRLSETTNPNNGKECAEYVNDITGAGLGSTWASKQAKIDSNITAPKEGDTAIWIPDPSNKTFAQYGHAGIVTGSDGTNVTIKSSNLNGRGEISTITVPISQIKQTGGFANTSIKGSEKTKPLSDKQYTQYNQATSKFIADPNVKAFESALSQGGDLMESLKSANGPGDVGAIFNFMKTLDPSSTVREGEFALAAKSAGVWEQFKNIPANKLEGTILSDEQRKAFGKLAFEYVKNKGKSYDIKYNDLTRILENQGIPKTYYPTKMTDMIGQYDGTNTTNINKTDFMNQITQIAQDIKNAKQSITR